MPCLPMQKIHILLNSNKRYSCQMHSYASNSVEKNELRTHKHTHAHHTCGFCFYVCVLLRRYIRLSHTHTQTHKRGVHGASKELKRYNIQMRAESVNASASFHGLFFTLRVCMVFKFLFYLLAVTVVHVHVRSYERCAHRLSFFRLCRHQRNQ